MSTLAVTDLHQWIYCPRIPYFDHVMPLRRVPTGKMVEGRRVHVREDALVEARSLRAYGISRADEPFYERRPGVSLKHDELGLSGKPDLVLVGQGRAIVVEHKFSRGPLSDVHRLQVGGYAMLIEACWGVPVVDGFVHFTVSKRTARVAVTDSLRATVCQTRDNILLMMAAESFPEATSVAGRCRECEFRRFCNDRPSARS